MGDDPGQSGADQPSRTWR